MDPLSITVSCITLIGAIATTSKTITTFIRDVRDARSDLDLVSRELLSLQTVLSLLADDVKASGQGLPATLERQILGIIANCDRVVAEIEASLAKLGKSRLGRGGSWTVGGGKDNMARLRLTLEAHKSALDIALDMISISIARDIKNDTEDIKDDTAAIRDDTAQILAEIARLQARLPIDNTRGSASNFVLQRYLDDLTSYAESEFEPSVADSVETSSSCTAMEIVPELIHDDVETHASSVLESGIDRGTEHSSDVERVQKRSGKASPTGLNEQCTYKAQAAPQEKQDHAHEGPEAGIFSDSESSDGTYSDAKEEADLHFAPFAPHNASGDLIPDDSDNKMIQLIKWLLKADNDGASDEILLPHMEYDPAYDTSEESVPDYSSEMTIQLFTQFCSAVRILDTDEVLSPRFLQDLHNSTTQKIEIGLEEDQEHLSELLKVEPGFQSFAETTVKLAQRKVEAQQKADLGIPWDEEHELSQLLGTSFAGATKRERDIIFERYMSCIKDIVEIVDSAPLERRRRHGSKRKGKTKRHGRAEDQERKSRRVRQETARRHDERYHLTDCTIM